MDKTTLELLKPLLRTNPMFSTFALGDGTCYFCSSCGRRSEGNQPPIVIDHKPGCGFLAHHRAIAVLRQMLGDAGIEV